MRNGRHKNGHFTHFSGTPYHAKTPNKTAPSNFILSSAARASGTLTRLLLLLFAIVFTSLFRCHGYFAAGREKYAVNSRMKWNARERIGLK